VNNFRNAIGAHYLPHSSEYVAPPSIDVVRQWFPSIRYWEEVLAKGTLRKSLLPPRWRLLMTQIMQCLGGKTGGFDQITKKDAIILYSLANGIDIDYANIFWEDIIIKLKKKQREKQATGGPTSLGVTSEESTNPQLSSDMSTFNLNKPIFSAYFIIHSESASGCDASADSTAKADPRLSALNDSIPQQQGMDEGTKNTSYDHIFAVEEEETSNTIKLEDLAKLVSHVQPSFKNPDSPEDDPVIVMDDSDEDEDDEVHATENVETKDTLVSKSSSPSSLPTKMKDLPSKFDELTEEVKGLKKQVHELEIELPGDLKEISTKLEDFIKTVTSLTSQVTELKSLQWELPVEFLLLPVH
ncbi:hypothetical protein Tco_0546188, partial [Tanacetum coccineum]